MFDQALDFVIAREGGYVNNPNDHGGPTNCGITQVTYDRYRELIGRPKQDVLKITGEEVKDCYFQFYWIDGHCDLFLPPKVALVHFDACVNHGTGRAMKLLQDALGVSMDGIWGPATEAAAKACDDRQTAILYILIRSECYAGIVHRDPTQKVFANGWRNRLVAVQKKIMEAA